MARVKVFMEMIIDHKYLVSPESFPTTDSLIDLGKSQLLEEIQMALDDGEDLTEYFKSEVIED